jgi:hypothetical protein
MSLTKSYQGYKRPRDGKVDPYSGYLHQLRAHHGDQAVAITEFGVPSALGVAHRGPIGRDQGDHSEQEAMRMDADMLRDIHEEGFAAGLMFEWTDEWFKFTWNTINLEVPGDRRQLWRNDLAPAPGRTELMAQGSDHARTRRARRPRTAACQVTRTCSPRPTWR